jgi:hypothetical protein
MVRLKYASRLPGSTILSKVGSSGWRSASTWATVAAQGALGGLIDRSNKRWTNGVVLCLVQRRHRRWRQDFHLLLDPLRELVLCHFQIIPSLQAHPDCGARAKVACQPERRIRCNGPLAMHNLMDAQRRHADILGQAILAESVAPQLTVECIARATKRSVIQESHRPVRRTPLPVHGYVQHYHGSLRDIWPWKILALSSSANDSIMLQHYHHVISSSNAGNCLCSSVYLSDRQPANNWLPNK